MTSHRGHGARAGAGERLDRDEAPSRSTGNRLDFYKALSDFRGMFPSMSDDVIEAVLRANDGMVEATIDQLLAMSIDTSSDDSSKANRDPAGDRLRVANMDAEALSGATGDLLDLPDASVAQSAASQRQASPAGSRRAGGTAALPPTLVSLDASTDSDLAGTSTAARAPPAAAAAAAVDFTSSAIAAVTFAGNPAATFGASPQHFDDPFADLFTDGGSRGRTAALAGASLLPDSAWLPGDRQAAATAAAQEDEEQRLSQTRRPVLARDSGGTSPSAGGHSPPGRDTNAGSTAAAALPSSADAAWQRSGDSGGSPGAAAAAGSSAAVHGGEAQPHLPRPPKPLGISLSLPLPPSQSTPAAAASLAGGAAQSSDLDRSASPLSGSSSSAELGWANDGRHCLTLPIMHVRDHAGSAAAGGSSSPHRTQLSPCSGGSADISPGEIVDLLEQGDELPPSLPPPRRGSAKRKEQQQRQQGGSDGSGALSPQLQAAADRWSVPLVGQLPRHFLRLEEDETPPPPRPPKPRSKLGLHSQDDSLLHTHQERSQKLGRSRSQRNAMIIGALVATREAAAAAASSAAAAAADVHDQPSSERGRKKALPAGERSGAGTLPAGSLEQQGGGGGAHRSRHQRRLPGERLSTNEMKMKIAENERRLKETCDLEDLDEETVRYLEDERLALIMQNEEFLREVKRNEDFMRTLEFEQQLLEARLVVDRSRRHAAAQARAKTLDAFARRPSEMDSDVISAALHPASTSPECHSPQGGSWPQTAAGSAAGASSSSSDTKASLDTEFVRVAPRVAVSGRSPPMGSAGVLGSSGGSSGGTVSQGGGSTGSAASQHSGSSAQSGSGGSLEPPTPPLGGRSDAAGGADAGGSAEFRRQLQGMGASSKKKFAVLAKNFFTRKVKRSHHPHNPIGLSRTPLGPSTLNLLDDCDDEDLELDQDNEASTCTSAHAMTAARHAPYDD